MYRYIIIIGCIWGLRVQVQAQSFFTLPMCIDYAITHSHDLKDYSLQQKEAVENVEHERHSFLPVVNMEIQNGVSSGFQQVFTKEMAGQYESVNSYTNSTVLSASLPLWSSNAQRVIVRLKQKKLSIAKQQTLACELSLRLSVIEKFYALALAKFREKIAEEQTILQDSMLEANKKMYEHGLSAYKELISAEASMESDKHALLEEKQNVETALAELKHVMNCPDNIDISVDMEEKQDKLLMPSLSELENFAFRKSPDLRVAEMKVTSAALERKSYVRQRYPSLSLNLQAGTSGQHLFSSPNMSMSSQWHHNAYQVTSLVLKIPLFNQFVTRNQIRKADISIMRLQTALDKERDELRYELEKLHKDISQCEQMIPQAEKMKELSRVQYDMARKDYKNGNIPSYELNTYKNKWIAASLTLLRKKLEYEYKIQTLKTLTE